MEEDTEYERTEEKPTDDRLTENITDNDEEAGHDARTDTDDGMVAEETGKEDETENDVENDNQTIVNEAKISSRTDNKRALRSKGPVEKLPHVMKKPIEYVECVWNGMICKVPANQFSKQCRSNRRK